MISTRCLRGLRSLGRYRCLMQREAEPKVGLTSGQVARMLDVSQATVSRIPKDRLDYWTTPGGHRRYRRGDVVSYARQWLSLDLGTSD